MQRQRREPPFLGAEFGLQVKVTRSKEMRAKPQRRRLGQARIRRVWAVKTLKSQHRIAPESGNQRFAGEVKAALTRP